MRGPQAAPPRPEPTSLCRVEAARRAVQAPTLLRPRDQARWSAERGAQADCPPRTLPSRQPKPTQAAPESGPADPRGVCLSRDEGPRLQRARRAAPRDRGFSPPPIASTGVGVNGAARDPGEHAGARGARACTAEPIGARARAGTRFCLCGGDCARYLKGAADGRVPSAVIIGARPCVSALLEVQAIVTLDVQGQTRRFI